MSQSEQLKISEERQKLVRQLLAEKADKRSSCPRKTTGGGLTALRAGRGRMPLFLVPAGGATSLAFQSVAKYFDQSQPVYCFEPKWCESNEPAFDSLQSLAADNIEQLLQLRPQGPYALAGWCFGGVVAFEMGQQLVKKGETVQFLASVDGVPKIQTEAAVANEDGLLRLGLRALGHFGRGTAVKALREARTRRLRTQRLLRGEGTRMDRYNELREHHSALLRRYKVEFYPGVLHIYASEEYYKSYPSYQRWLEFAGPNSGIEVLPDVTHKQLVRDEVEIEKLVVRLQRHLWSTI